MAARARSASRSSFWPRAAAACSPRRARRSATTWARGRRPRASSRTRRPAMNIGRPLARLGPEDEVLTHRPGVRRGRPDLGRDRARRVVRAPLRVALGARHGARRACSRSATSPRRPARSVPGCELCRACARARACSRWSTARTRPARSPVDLAAIGADCLRRQRPQVALRAKGCRVPVGAAGAPARIDPLVVSWGWPRPGSSAAARLAGDARPGRVRSRCRPRSRSSASGGSGRRCGRGATRSSSGSSERGRARRRPRQFGQMADGRARQPCDPGSSELQRRLCERATATSRCRASRRRPRRCYASRCRATTTSEDLEQLVDAMRLAGIEPATSRSGGARSIP